jgi:hypothetical protein
LHNAIKELFSITVALKLYADFTHYFLLSFIGIAALGCAVVFIVVALYGIAQLYFRSIFYRVGVAPPVERSAVRDGATGQILTGRKSAGYPISGRDLLGIGGRVDRVGGRSVLSVQGARG